METQTTDNLLKQQQAQRDNITKIRQAATAQAGIKIDILAAILQLEQVIDDQGKELEKILQTETSLLLSNIFSVVLLGLHEEDLTQDLDTVGQKANNEFDRVLESFSTNVEKINECLEILADLVGIQL
ncbi:hypothetical protein C5B42_03080 [Candidatus Cerribacteria bacterium 'Amazon FNV 2010 28 9']|uniref:Uncharacterized protein n=1 Tax=Candidatus Cerribacteria bacterium 'Amazon FNV 2010 28 9' TaxID=2081795 RepID=A0A317JTW5_9BACT|nr:MAG: hypothetical protein C5B42_03080 [Candidatus Cerribacteria bacterium 'Amazon FNV 2010 28 9']